MSSTFSFKDQAFLASLKRTFSPASYGGLQGWLKADSFTALNDGDPVGTPGEEWIDQSGNGNDAFNPGPNGNPTWHENVFGTMPAVRSDGAPTPGEFLNLPNLTFPGDLTIIVVASTVTAADTIWLGDNNLNHQIRRNRGGANACSFYAGGSEVISDLFATGSANITMMTWRRSAGTVSFRENKTARGGGADANTLQLDSIFNTLFLGSGQGDLAELAAYNQHRSDAEVDALYDNYFKPRWTGLP